MATQKHTNQNSPEHLGIHFIGFCLVMFHIFRIAQFYVENYIWGIKEKERGNIWLATILQICLILASARKNHIQRVAATESSRWMVRRWVASHPTRFSFKVGGTLRVAILFDIELFLYSTFL